MDDLLQQGITVFKAGKRDEARKIFITVVKQSPDNELAWGWMYQAANNDQERIHCLKQILRINPKNEKVQQLLDSLTIYDFPFETSQDVTLPILAQNNVAPVIQTEMPAQTNSQEVQNQAKKKISQEELDELIKGLNKNLSGVDLSELDLAGADLSEADLHGQDLSHLGKVGLFMTNLKGADLSGANLSGVTNLIGGFLRGANLSGANLNGLDLHGQDLSGLNLSGANLTAANLGGADLSKVNLSKAHLIGAILSGLNLSGANLSGTDLSETDLSDVNLKQS